MPGERLGKRQEHLEELKKRLRNSDKAYIIRVLEQTAKYAWAYLEGYPVYWGIITKDGNPKEGKPEEAILVIRVWLPLDYLTDEELRAEVEKMIEELEEADSRERDNKDNKEVAEE